MKQNSPTTPTGFPLALALGDAIVADMVNIAHQVCGITTFWTVPRGRGPDASAVHGGGVRGVARHLLRMGEAASGGRREGAGSGKQPAPDAPRPAVDARRVPELLWAGNARIGLALAER